MLVYRILPQPGVDTDITIIPGMQLVPVAQKTFGTWPGIPLDDNFMFRKYGFRMSEYERNAFVTHYDIWDRFAQTDAPYCFVIENATCFRQPLQAGLNAITDILEANPDWDVLFPFEPPELPTANSFDPHYLLGYHWGMAAYFISRNGVEKLLAIPAIRQPVDEEVLTLSMADKLEVFNVEMDFLEYGDNVLQKEGRKEAVRAAVFESNAWSPENREKARNLMRVVSVHAREHLIDLSICYGSLLGHVRHGEIMPWDDDIDLAMDGERYQELRSSIEQEGTLEIAIFQWGKEKIDYAKIWMKDGENIPGFPYNFPFVDIWFYKETDGQILFDGSTVYSSEIYLPLQDISFEGCSLKMPRHPLRCLDLIYPHWRTKICVYTWSHRLEQESFMPLMIDISVDQDGRMI